MTRIRRLGLDVVNRIAAGEVVERPASAVKELIENSLDAGASRIDVAVREGGASLIAVEDDGCGMSADDLALAIERHATSKLPGDDLACIDTFGFRGEALPSIGAVARLEITSRSRDAEHGWRLAVEGGARRPIEPAARAPGTRVEIRDLFFATPARLKFLKSPQTELGHIVETVERLAMAQPTVAFSLGDGKRTLLAAPAEADTTERGRLSRLARILGREFAENAVAIGAARDDIAIAGFAGLPTLHQRSAARQFLFVNCRPVRDRLLHGALRAAYQDLIAADRHPLCALFLTLPVDEVDVNVHPMKTEVRFRDARAVRALLVGALRHALAEAGHRASSTAAVVAFGAARPAGGGAYGRSLFESPPAAPAAALAEAAAFFAPIAPSGEPAEDRAPAAAEVPPLGFARAQLHGMFIVSQTVDGMVIVDQHAAHERVVHENLKAQMLSGAAPTQLLLVPQIVELSERAANAIEAHDSALRRLGLVVERFGDGAVVVREIPATLVETNVAALIRDLAEDLLDLDAAVALQDRLSAVCARMACHGSVRAGRSLSQQEMNALLRAMEATAYAGQCSHGRPTYVELKRADIERMFGRR